MEYVLGPILALLFGMKFTHFTDGRLKKKVTDLTARVERVEKLVDVIDKQTLQKMVVTLQPVATELQTIKDFVGIRDWPKSIL